MLVLWIVVSKNIQTFAARAKIQHSAFTVFKLKSQFCDNHFPLSFSLSLSSFFIQSFIYFFIIIFKLVNPTQELWALSGTTSRYKRWRQVLEEKKKVVKQGSIPLLFDGSIVLFLCSWNCLGMQYITQRSSKRKSVFLRKYAKLLKTNMSESFLFFPFCCVWSVEFA